MKTIEKLKAFICLSKAEALINEHHLLQWVSVGRKTFSEIEDAVDSQGRIDGVLIHCLPHDLDGFSRSTVYYGTCGRSLEVALGELEEAKAKAIASQRRARES